MIETIIFGPNSKYWNTFGNTEYVLRLIMDTCDLVFLDKGHISLKEIYDIFGIRWDDNKENVIYTEPFECLITNRDCYGYHISIANSYHDVAMLKEQES